jgi:Tfp pilus assembly protein PilF
MRVLIAFLALLTVSGTCLSQSGTERATEPDSSKIWYSVGKDYLNKEVWDAAVSNLKRALSYDSTMISAYVDIAWAYLKLNKADSAETMYKKVADIDSTDSRGWQGLGFMYGIVKKQAEQGIIYYGKAIETDPDNYEARFGLARLLDQEGRKEEADSIYLSAVQGNPDSPGIAKAYALFLVEQLRYKEALPYLDQAVEAFRGDRELSDAYIKANMKVAELEGSTTCLTNALNQVVLCLVVDSTDYSLFIKKGEIFEKLNMTDSALAAYDVAAELAPESPIPLLKKSSLLVDKKTRISTAIKLAKDALDLEMPTDLWEAAAYAHLGDAYATMGTIKFDAKEWKESVDYYDLSLAAYRNAMSCTGPYVSYAKQRLDFVDKKRTKAWRKWKGIE